ncbi:peroxidase-related enzyme [Fodinibius halophilus]|uniref:Peroxidase-related enzyme n=1 Tax=Fodinibius halophilus TaxID=1736908 RepID=A0A6M1T7Y3_9BACT|nr:peroxidase-related enzyme [Fodinibius halophilus]NGP88753.1 peroxidase-related enzyme [Fodinibius halophilus]
MAYIDIVEPEEATGNLKEIYEELEQRRGKIAQIHKIQSLNPDSIMKHMDLYMSIMFGSSPLKRAQREMIAVVVSAANECEYCQLHHGEALNHYWKEEERVKKLRDDYTSIDLNDIDTALCRLAWELTRNPEAINKEEYIKPLKELELSDRAILDAVLGISYFNFVNRIVMGLGVEADKKEVQGYKY